ncbi:MAG: hypothetical protein J5917_06475 [Bacteroidales bacterium]|nr:hypothetical protein [Bacteroidales bacterium]
MKGIFRSHILLCLTVLVALSGLSSCKKEDGIGDLNGELQSVRLSLIVGTPQASKADASHYTEVHESAPVFRGLTDMKMVSFEKAGTVTADDVAHGTPLSIPSISNLYSNLPAFFYPSGVDAFIPIGTSSVLLYGRAPADEGADLDALESKRRYGSLVLRGFDRENNAPPASSLGFAPDVMSPGGAIPAQASQIATILNAIVLGAPYRVTAYYRPSPSSEEESVVLNLNWNESVPDNNLREAYRGITNDGAVIPGSGPLMESLLSELYALFWEYESHNSNVYEITVNGIPYELTDAQGNPLLYKDLLNGLRKTVLDRFTYTAFAQDNLQVDPSTHAVAFKREDLRAYPENLGLPSGCAILRWTPAGFVVPQISGVEGIAPINRYCFPPALYYYANTGIRTSQDEDIASAYTSHTSWSALLDDYTLGTSVTSNTRSVALVQPMHYAVAMLSATVKADRSWLQDNDNLPETTVDATGDNLPLTGIILGGQYAQNFAFEPIPGGEEYFTYDQEVPGVCLTQETSAPIRTLSLPTLEGEDVYFTLEFRNDSGKTFHGADGRVLPGRKFYMVGKMELPQNSAERLFESIFVKDHVTTLSCTIHSLAGAYNAVPDLTEQQLVLGVQTRTSWILSSPTTLLLE